MTVTNSGMFTTNDNVNLVVGNDFVQNGTGNSTIGGNITSTNDGIDFSTNVTLDGTDGETLTFQSGEGDGDDITLQGNLSSNADEDILFDAGELGDISVDGTTNVGIGNVTITDAHTVLFTGKVTADNLSLIHI